MRSQSIDVPGAVLRLTERIDSQLDSPQSETTVELPTQGDHLDVEMGIVDAEYLDADLIELPVPAALRLLVTKVRAGVPRLPGHDRTMLHERTTHAGGLFRA